MPVTELRLTPLQTEHYKLLIIDKEPNVDFVGGLGSGKTVVGTAETLTLLEQYPGIRGLLAAPTYDQMVQGSLVTFMEWCDPSYIAHHDRTQKIITFVWKDEKGNPSQLLYRSTSEIDRIRAHEYGFCWWDEKAMSPEGTLQVIRGRLRAKRGVPDDWQYPIFGTSTPRGRNWLYRQHAAEKLPQESQKQYENRRKRYNLVEATTYDNADNLPPGYIEEQEAAMQGDQRLIQQELLGQFVSFEGLVFGQFDEFKHVKPIEAPNPIPYESADIIRRFAGVDFGGGDPTALGLYGQGKSGKIHKFAERTWRGPVGLTEIGGQLHEWHAQGALDFVACDPSNQPAIATLRSSGLNAIPQTAGVVGGGANTTARAINDREEGLRLCGELLSRSVITWNPNCADSISEFYSYLYKKSTDGEGNQFTTSTPIDHHGDHMDEWRYAMMALYVYKGGTLGGRTGVRPVRRRKHFRGRERIAA